MACLGRNGSRRQDLGGIDTKPNVGGLEETCRESAEGVDQMRQCVIAWVHGPDSLVQRLDPSPGSSRDLLNALASLLGAGRFLTCHSAEQPAFGHAATADVVEL